MVIWNVTSCSFIETYQHTPVFRWQVPVTCWYLSTHCYDEPEFHKAVRVCLRFKVWPEFDSRYGKIFLFPTASRPGLGPTQSTIQWVMGVLSLGGKVARV
jgi:hypothetical protein